MATRIPNADPTSDDARHADRPSPAHASDAPEAASSATRPRPRPTSPVAAAPPRRTFFDPWNSSSTGHQRAENRLGGSTSWRASRSLKLGEQFRAGRDGGKRVADTVGAGSEDFGKDGRKDNGSWEKGAKGLRTGGQKSLAEVWAASKAGSSRKPSQEKDEGIATVSKHAPPDVGTDSDTHPQSDVSSASSKPSEKQIFTGLCFYLNGSTAPLVSDHKLKQLCAAHGASHSISLGRRTVTHVILGRVNCIGSGGGAGGGLAASKMQKEITRTGGKAVKFINAEWVLDSIKAGRRLPESRYSPLKLAHQSQSSVLGMMRIGATSSKSQQEQQQG
ncbi:hypothetical protein J4E85_003937 [Alternaria conjuncta]|uniref:uncharacterized protein n=1 Tax=Alternaria conjuncta TaxID=181017 RepID=UPI00221F5C14|nr:uncharacterized protein J4E85_003937 [Alternaria conjuncta]KAI4931345.1 hypothetical protein J4E85_003937 [Alternaria conjuncta]